MARALREPGLLRIIGVHSPGVLVRPRPRGRHARRVEQMDIPYAVVLDPDFAVWREYGNRGWPARYIFDRRGVLRFVHWGEGEYDETERVIQDLIAETDPEGELELPDVLEPLRPEDAPARRWSRRRPTSTLPDEAARVELSGAGAGGDYSRPRTPAPRRACSSAQARPTRCLSGSVEAGLYPTDGTVVAEAAGLRLHGFQFTPLPPSH